MQWAQAPAQHLHQTLRTVMGRRSHVAISWFWMRPGLMRLVIRPCVMALGTCCVLPHLWAKMWKIWIAFSGRCRTSLLRQLSGPEEPWQDLTWFNNSQQVGAVHCISCLGKCLPANWLCLLLSWRFGSRVDFSKDCARIREWDLRLHCLFGQHRVRFWHMLWVASALFSLSIEQWFWHRRP